MAAWCVFAPTHRPHDEATGAMADTKSNKASRGYVSPYLEYIPRTQSEAEQGSEPKRDVLPSGDRRKAPREQPPTVRNDSKSD